MDSSTNTILVNVNIEVATEALEAVVANAKQVGAAASGMDTADTLSFMISKFLGQQDFTRFVRDPENYSPSE